MEIEYDGQKFEIVKPTQKQNVEAQMNASKEFNKARTNGAVLRDALDTYLREQGVWNDEKQKELIKLTTELDETIVELKKGKSGKYKKMSEARKAAIRVRQLRYAQSQLLSESRKLDNYTAESLAEQGRFDYLCSVCIKRNGERAFSSLEDYLNQATEPWVIKCATEFSYLLYPGLDRNWEDKLPENRFLKKYNMVNEEGSLINKDGHLVDEEFRLINEKGDWVDSEGKLVNSKGERVDEDGDVICTDYEAFDNDLE